MYLQTKLFDLFDQEIRREEKLVNHFSKRLAELPAGYLCYKHGYPYRVVQTADKIEQLIISPDFQGRETLINELKESRLIKKSLPILKQNLAHCRTFMKRFQLYDPVAIKQTLPACYQDFGLSPLMPEGDLDPHEWAQEPYPRNEAYPEHLRHVSEGGLLTRSKSEVLIATKLEEKGVIFRYEPLLTLGNHTLSPDFCTLHPAHRRLIYCEHFGKMDDPDYASDAMRKLELYSEHGYCLGDNLIMTWESKAAPLQLQHINRCISLYLS